MIGSNTRVFAGLAAALTLAGAPAGLAADKAGQATVYFLGGSKVMSIAPDGTAQRTVVEQGPGGLNDGIAFDPVGRHIYWTNMGRANADDGTVTRSDLDGSNVVTVVPAGGAFTPKQLKIDPKGRKLYWSDREGMKIMRANLDGSNIEVLVQTGSTDQQRKEQARWCVGIALDLARGEVYWTQKGADNAGQGTIKRAKIEIPKGQTAADRTDIQVLFSGLPEPIDLDLDLSKRQIYWTDRGDNPDSRAPMDPPRGADPAHRTDRKVLVTGLHEAIGVVLDLPNKRMFYTSLGGEVGASDIDGAGAKLLLTNQGTLTGITLVEPMKKAPKR
jgi:sugar lactone lactonase YvrE